MSTLAIEMDTNESQGDPLPLVTPIAKQSWVKVAQKKQVLKKYDLDIQVSDGKQSVEVPSEILEKANLL